MAANELRFEIIVDDSNGTAVIHKFEHAATDSYKKVSDSGKVRSKETIDSWEKAHKNMTGGWERWKTVALGALSKVGAYKIAGWAKKIATGFMEVAVQTETLQLRLQSLLGSTEESTKLFEDLSKFAGKVPFTFGEIAESGTMLAGVLKGGRKEIMQYMPMIADLAAATGVGIQETTGQFMRMVSAGIGACDLWREKGVKSMLGFKEGVQYSSEESVKMFINAWTRAGSEFRGATDKLKSSWSGMLSMFSGAWREFRQAVMDADVFAALKTSAGTLLEKIDTLKKEGKLDKWAKDMAEFCLNAFDKLLTGIKWVGIAILSLQAAWRLVKWSFCIMLEKIFSGLSTLTEKLASIYEWVGKWTFDPDKIIMSVKIRGWSKDLENLSKDFKVLGDECETATDKSSSAINTWEETIQEARDGLKNLKTGTDEAADTFNNELTPAVGNAGESFSTAGQKAKNLEEDMMGMLDAQAQLELQNRRIAEQNQRISETYDSYLFPSLEMASKAGEGMVEIMLTLNGVTTRQFIPAARKAWSIMVPIFEKSTTALDRFKETFGGLVEAMLRGFGDILANAESFGGAMKGLFGFLRRTIITDFMGGMSEAFKTGFGEAKDKGGGFLGRLKGGFGGIGKFLGGDWIGGIISAVTTFMPMLVGLFHKPEWKKVGEEVGRDLGVEISEELSKKIAETSKEMGSRFGAITMHLGEIIDEVGLTAENFESFAKRAHDALALVGQGVLTTEQAAETLNETFPKLVEAAEEFGITMNRELIDIIIHSREMGIEIKAVTEYVKGQLGAATDALTKMVAGFTSGSQEEFDRLSRLTLAVFNEMAANGASMVEQFDALKDVIGALAQKQEEMGLAGSAAFDSLKRFQNLVETNRELVESVTSVGDMLTALGNIGALTEETFADLTAQAVGGFDKLVAAGFTSQEALTMMVPSLKAIQQAQETYGFTIDDNTQKLLDQAETLGLLESSDPAEVMKEGFEGVVEAIDKLTDALVGHSLLTALEQCAGAAETFSGQLDETFDPSQLERFTGVLGTLGQGLDETLDPSKIGQFRKELEALGAEKGGFPSMQMGGLVTEPGLKYLHPGEVVLRAGQAVEAPSGEGQVLNLQVVVPVTILDEELTPRLFRRIYDGSKKGELKIHAIAVEKG